MEGRKKYILKFLKQSKKDFIKKKKKDKTRNDQKLIFLYDFLPLL